MTSRQIPTPAADELEAAYRPLQVRFSAAVAEVESALVLAVAMGRADWCNTFRDAHFSDPGQPFQRDPGQRFKLISDRWRGARVPV